MADFIASARSNYFSVVDRDTFDTWLASLPMALKLITDTDQDLAETKVGLLFDEPHGMDLFFEDEHGDERDFLKELAAHLSEGEVAIFIEAGAEGLRYVSGLALAIQKTPEAPEGYQQLTLRLSDIYELVQHNWGVKATAAEY